MPQDPRNPAQASADAGRRQRDLFDEDENLRSADRLADETRTIGEDASDGDTDPRFVGVPSGVDPEAIQEDLVERIDKDHSQGRKTRSRSKQIVSGKPYG